MASPRITVRTFYPADPVGVVPGGVDTFIRGIFKWAPEDLDFEAVGMTTDRVARPRGRWSLCDLGRRTFRFLPVVEVADAGSRTRIPLSIRFMAGVLSHWGMIRHGFDVFDFHRIEPALLHLRDPRPKNAFFHQDMGVIRSEAKADILWRYFPSVYFALERRVVSALASGWCVREEGVAALRERNPANAKVLRFVPTWVDTEVFHPLDDTERRHFREHLSATTGLDPSATWVVTVGRLDLQKNPQLLLDAMAGLVAGGHDLRWLAIGDGVLRGSLEDSVRRAGLGRHVAFVGLKRPAEIAQIVSAADVFALPSAYEGMPMALLEAMACGVPAVSTDVGEVRRVLRPGENGEIAIAQTADAFAAALLRTVERAAIYRGAPTIAAVEPYQPQKVLQPVYENYRRLARDSAARGAPAAQELA